MKIIKGYKITDKNMQCRGFQYELGKKYVDKGKLELCDAGFHFCHTNTLEGFWSLLKRGVIGQFHYVTAKHLNKYIDEFCFRYNNRDNKNVFSLTILKAVTI